VLERKHLDYERIEVEPSIAAELRRRYETDDVPLLEDHAHAVAGARPIAFYLERTYGPPSIFPSDPQKRNQAVTLAEFAEQAIGMLTARLLLDRAARRSAGARSIPALAISAISPSRPISSPAERSRNWNSIETTRISSPTWRACGRRRWTDAEGVGTIVSSA
jgi:glutathione S-transferase